MSTKRDTKASKAAKTRISKAGTKEVRVQLFVGHYLTNGLNATEAYKALHPTCKQNTAEVEGCKMLADPDVKAALAALTENVRSEVEVTTQDVLREIQSLMQADPADLVELRRVCCRYCHGSGHLYQFTPAEWKRAQEEHERRLQQHIAAGKSGDDFPAIDPEGGVGYDKRKPPVPDCPECFGEGVEDLHLKASKDVPAKSRRLYIGAKKGRHGIEIDTGGAQRMKAVELAARYNGMLTDNTNLTTPEGGPLAGLLQEIAGTSLKPRS